MPAGGNASAMGHTSPPRRTGIDAPQSVAQRRHVTFLFADLVGSSALSEQLDPEAFHALIDQWLQAMTEEVERFGGMLNQFSGDGILALFGAPLAQEDAPVQACRAALALQRRVVQLDTPVRLAMRVGVDSGEIVAGLVGTDRRNEYAALGQRTNRAKRVQEQADPGSILISQDTHDLVREYFRLVPAGEFTAKGLAELVVGYRLIDDAAQAQVARLSVTMARWHSPLVGRAAEIESLEKALHAAAGGRAQRLAIGGDAGVGKSRLLYELAERARRAGFAVFEGRSTALRAHVPYAPYADILRSLCGVTAADSAGDTAAKLRAHFPDSWSALHEVVEAPTAQAAPALIDANGRMLATLSALVRALRGQAARRPLLLVLDDVHWSDPLSRQLTANLVDGDADAALLVCTAERSRDAVFEPAASTSLSLQPLRAADIVALVSVLDGLAAKEVADLAAWLERQTGGLPLFIEELLVALRSTGALRHDGSRWHLAPDFQREHLPGSVQDLIASRIDRLAADALEVLQLAAIIGEDCRAAEIEQLGERGPSAAALAALEEQGLIVQAAEAWRFRSALARRVVYGTIPRSRRAALHLRLAQALDRDGARLVDDTVLAHHFESGGDTRRAVALLRRAAARAEWGFANTDAEALLTEVMRIGGPDLPDADRADVLLQRGRVRTTFLGDAAGVGDIDAAIDIAARSGDPALHGRAVLTKGVALYRQFRFAESLEWLERAEEAAREAGAPELHIEALLQRAFVASEIRISGTAPSEANVARLCCEQALALSREHGHRPLEIQSLHSLGTAYLQELDYQRAEEMFQHCIAQSRQVEDRPTESLALQSLARVQQFRGDFAAAADTIEHLRGLLRQLGDDRRLAFSAFNLAAALLGCGRPDDARRAAEEALPQATRLGLDYLRKLVLRFLIGMYDGEHHVAQRVEACETLRTLLTGEDERAELGDLLGLLADVYAAAGRPERTAAVLADAAKLDIDLANYTRAQASLARLQALRSPPKAGA
jgi:class 3 adenylate cyclase/tetratricopeptide (TPR) repeat protein